MSEKRKAGTEARRRITAGMEDYLEAIYEFCRENDCSEIRITDIARCLRVSRPSVVGMIRHLAEHDLVVHTHYGRVILTAEGKEVAKETAHRHRVLQRFLEEVLGLDAEIAETDACRMEHTLSPRTIDRFIALEEFRETTARSQTAAERESFRRYLKGREIKPPAAKTSRKT